MKVYWAPYRVKVSRSCGILRAPEDVLYSLICSPPFCSRHGSNLDCGMILVFVFALGKSSAAIAPGLGNHSWMETSAADYQYPVPAFRFSVQGSVQTRYHSV